MDKYFYMKNLILYYAVIIIPIPILVWLSFNNSLFFVISLFLYLIFRNFTDGFRLYKLDKIEKKDIWKTNLMSYQFKYFKVLYLGKS